jgi:hypothetical protein
MKYACLIIETGKVLEKDFTMYHLHEITHSYPSRCLFKDNDKVAESMTKTQALELVNNWNRMHQANLFLYWVI